MKHTLALVAILGIFAAVPAYALDLASARTSGAVCEKGDGYIAAANSSPDVANLVSSVNDGRKAEYARISKEKSQPVDVVAKLAAQQIVAKGSKLCK